MQIHECTECGMTVNKSEYHPYAACLMFKSSKSSRTVRSSLRAVKKHAIKDEATLRQAAKDMGYVMVPLEPSDEMVERARLELFEQPATKKWADIIKYQIARALYKAMIGESNE